jgi:hypothetical protein
MLTPFERALVAHLVADWLLQNDWMAANKMKLLHPAAWVHGGIHFIGLTLALGWPSGLVLTAIHMVIDTRIVLRWWQRVFCQTREGPVALHVGIWGDQVLHIFSIALWIMLMSTFS